MPNKRRDVVFPLLSPPTANPVHTVSIYSPVFTVFCILVSSPLPWVARAWWQSCPFLFFRKKAAAT